MKQYRVVSSEQSIASFMVGLEKDEMTYNEYNEWSDYLERALTTENIQAKVYYGAEYLDELRHVDNGYLFNFGDKSIKLSRNKTIESLDLEVLSYIEVDTLLAIIDAIDAYQKDGAGLNKQ